jgi:pyridinium-3,5-biscarboxylic acid mononucleotide sulfurtransferase
MKPSDKYNVDKWNQFSSIIKAQGRVAIAFSGGVDSALLLKLCVDALGSADVLALTAVSELNPARELNTAREIAAFCGVRLIEVPIRALDVPEVAANPRERCYYCKKAIFSALKAVAASEGFTALLDGSNASDRGDFRPGKKAAIELGAISPFDLADITKAEIRQKSNSLGLPNWNAPAAACLASRIPYGTALTAEALRRVEKAEDALIALGFIGCRVRLHGVVARIEAPQQDIHRLVGEEMRVKIVAALKPLGFDFIALDMDGYRMGSLNHSN